MIQIKILELSEVMKATRLSRSTIYKRMREGTFPDQIKLGESERGERKVVWLESDIEGWLTEVAVEKEVIENLKVAVQCFTTDHSTRDETFGCLVHVLNN